MNRLFRDLTQRAPATTAVFATVALLSLPADAELAAPEGEIVLIISGEISATNFDDEARFDLAALEALPQTSFETTTIWTEGARNFTGVSLEDLLAAVGAAGETLNATALNDYSVEIPVSDAVSGGPIVAYQIDGAPMSVRDKGPLWIVYPYDSRRDYRSEVIYSRSIWQLSRIEVRD